DGVALVVFQGRHVIDVFTSLWVLFLCPREFDYTPRLTVILITVDLERQWPWFCILIVDVEIDELFARNRKLIEFRTRRRRFNMRQHLLQVRSILRPVLRIVQLAI